MSLPTEFEYNEKIDMFRATLQEAIELREKAVQGEGLLSLPINNGQADQIMREAQLLKDVWNTFKKVFDV